MEVTVDSRNDNHFIITLAGASQIKISKRTNKEEDLIEWLKSVGATEIKWVKKDDN